ncbi:MAG TPA: hypothetical protein VID75_00075 [Acidimicrobiales bacterium]
MAAAADSHFIHPQAGGVHFSFTADIHHEPMADFLVVLGIIAFVVVMLGLVWGLDHV